MLKYMKHRQKQWEKKWDEEEKRMAEEAEREEARIAEAQAQADAKVARAESFGQDGPHQGANPKTPRNDAPEQGHFHRYLSRWCSSQSWCESHPC